MGGASQARGAQQELLRRALHPQGAGLHFAERDARRGAGRWRRGGKRLAEGRSGRRARGLCAGVHPRRALHRPLLRRRGGPQARHRRGGAALSRHALPLGRQIASGHRLFGAGFHGLHALRHLHLPRRGHRRGLPHPRNTARAHAQGRSALLPRPRGRVPGRGALLPLHRRAGDDGFTINSLDPDAEDFRPDLAEKLSAVGSYF